MKIVSDTVLTFDLLIVERAIHTSTTDNLDGLDDIDAYARIRFGIQENATVMFEKETHNLSQQKGFALKSSYFFWWC